MIPWLVASAALAQETPTWVYGACEIFAPIAGTAGWTHAREAIRTNATTYSAGEFARRRLRGQNYFAMDFHVVAGATRVPSVCTAGDGTLADAGVYLQPVDLTATNLGLNVPVLSEGPAHSHAEVFYASSVTQSYMGARALTWSAPIANLYPAVFAPAIGRFSASRGLFTYGVDWIGGAAFSSDVVSVQAGYTGTRGLYLDVTQEKVALFVNGVGTRLSDGLQGADLQYLLGGVDQFDPRRWGVDDQAVGMTSLFYRDLPSGGEVVDRTGRRVSDRLKTLHLRQEDLFRVVDLRSSLDLSGGGRLRELAAAAHTRGWHRRPGLRGASELEASARLGMITLPDQPLLGVKGGPRPTFRADVVHQAGDDLVFAVRGSVRFNDPDLLDLYPFGDDALGVNVEVTLFEAEE